MEIGIVGLPNVGKSTLFNALLKVAQAESANFPFTTIEPNVGVISVPDTRLDQLAAIAHPKKILPASVKFVDIAGLVRGAHKGEGLGNQFLSHIREVDAIAMVVRYFDDPNVIHVAGKIDPEDDIRTIELELILADLATLTKRLDTLQGKVKTGDKTAQAQLTLFDRIRQLLETEKLAKDIGELSEDERRWVKELSLLTMKPFLYVANVNEAQLGSMQPKIGERTFIPISAKIEAELAELSPQDQESFLVDLGLTEPGRNGLIRAAYELLGLQSYFTAGPEEVRAWTIRRGMTAPQAAGVIHGDFERGFIRAEVISFDDYVRLGGEQGAREAGKLRSEGKEYVMRDGDVVHFRFNV